MPYFRRITLALISALLAGISPVSAEDRHTMQDHLHLSPALMELLREEMRALLSGMKSLPAAIATADWKNVADSSARIKASYILDRKLTVEQRHELKTSLPEHFVRLDSAFHREAGKLEAAALNHDAQLSTFHYYRLLEACTGCHAVYAPSRFPGFAPAASHHHDH